MGCGNRLWRGSAPQGRPRKTQGGSAGEPASRTRGLAPWAIFCRPFGAEIEPRHNPLLHAEGPDFVVLLDGGRMPGQDGMLATSRTAGRVGRRSPGKRSIAPLVLAGAELE